MLKVNPKLQYFLHAQAAKMLSAADLKLLVEAKEAGEDASHSFGLHQEFALEAEAAELAPAPDQVGHSSTC